MKRSTFKLMTLWVHLDSALTLMESMDTSKIKREKILLERAFTAMDNLTIEIAKELGIKEDK